MEAKQRTIYRLRRPSKLKTAPNGRSVYLYESIQPKAGSISWEDVATGETGVLPGSLTLADFKAVSHR